MLASAGSLSLYQALARSSNPTSRALVYETVLTGPFNHIPATAKEAVLDLSTPGPMPLLQLLEGQPDSPNGQSIHAHLHLYRLTLTNLAAAPLSLDLSPAARQASSSSAHASSSYTPLSSKLSNGNSSGGSDAITWSALPLWAFNRPTLAHALQGNSTDAHQLRLGAVTLQLPLPDFTALLSAVLRGAAWKSGAVATAPLMAGIQVLLCAPDVHITPGSQEVLLAAFHGW
jgi:hypothetical protein